MSERRPQPGDRVRFTTYGHKGSQFGTLNGYEFVGFGTVGFILTDDRLIVSRPVDRIHPAEWSCPSCGVSDEPVGRRCVCGHTAAL